MNKIITKVKKLNIEITKLYLKIIRKNKQKKY